MTGKLTLKLKPIHIAGLAVVLALLNFAVHWPGELTPDSKSQLIQATSGHFEDWHPPIMAVIWRWLLFFGSVTAPILALQIALHWFGIGLFAVALCLRDHYKASLIMLISGLTPIALKYTGIIQKDSLLASFLIAGFGLAALNDVRLKGGGLLIGLLGMLTRTNGIFAFPPLLFLLLRRTWLLPKAILFSLILSLALIPISQWINHDILRAEQRGIERSLQLYDIAGIAYFSNDSSVLPVNIPNLKRCYTPLFWDTLSSERCGNAFSRIDRDITRDWLFSIVTHPTAYARHRLAHFNRETFFLVPPAQQCVDAPEFHNCPKSFLSDTITKNGLLWPAAWLALGLVMLLSGLGDVARALCLSGLLYGFGYLVVGVAADFRYFYWTELAIQTALIFQLATLGFPRWRIATSAVLIIWFSGYVWRIVKFLSL